LQDNTLVRKIRKVITKRFLKFMDEESAKDAEAYLQFWQTFGIYIKEGITSDFEFQKELGKLVRFESSRSEPGKPISLADYIARMRPDQEEIYYINGPSREAIEAGPYIEMFRKNDIEILYTMEPIDDFVLTHLGEFEGKKLVSADRADLSLPSGDDKTEEETSAAEQESNKLSKDDGEGLLAWLKETLSDKVNEVIASKRLVESPAMIVNPDGHMTSSMERVLSASRVEGGLLHEKSKKNLEINLANPLIVQLAALKTSDQDFAKEVAAQIFDNAMIQAGLLVDQLSMVERNYRILKRVVKS
jgi:molecular chaperone HtpG